MKNNLPTEAGQSNSGQRQPPNTGHIDAINQVFALFQLNYHNQYFKAFSNDKDLNYIKRLWLDSLSRFEPEVLLKASRAVIENSEFLPTLKRMIQACEEAAQPDLPDAHQAFIEACQAPSPKAGFAWSHPIVYHAGKASDWFFLQNNPEHIAFPVFKANFNKLCERLLKGEELPAPQVKALPAETTTPLNKQENQVRLKQLRDTLKI